MAETETGGCLSPTAAKLFCLLSLAICFSAVSSRWYLSLLLKTAINAAAAA
jgi:hypothetical protein